jgi:hypothetical protein
VTPSNHSGLRPRRRPQPTGAHGNNPAVVCALAVAALVALPCAATPADTDHTPVVHYKIEATYDAGARTVSGYEIVRWRNDTEKTAHELWFHLYLNAFANNQSTFMRGTEDGWLKWAERRPQGWGYTVVSSVRVRGTERIEGVRFEQPDDGNPYDRTVFRLPLADPVAPGESVVLEIEFISKLPKVFARAGVAGPFAMVAQWYPKLGVFENGQWNCHQYHRTTEFFADFGTYDVTLTLPAEGVVGSTGIVRTERDNGDGTKTLQIVADNVHDFAWAVDPRFQVVEQEVEGVPVRLLLQPNHAGQAERHLEALRVAIGGYGERFGTYPYPQLTVVDPGAGAGRAGGMEYPMLVTAGTTWWMPEGLRVPELLTVHEFGHQYWYAVVANNEFEEAWLDEGVNTFVESRIMDANYGRGSYLDLFGLRVGSVPLLRSRYLQELRTDPITRRAWEFLDPSSYNASTYAKTALALETLDRHLGQGRVEEILAAYFQRWRFRHAPGKGLLDALRTERGVGDYVEAAFEGTGLLDYAVTEVVSEDTWPLTGYGIDHRGRPQDEALLGDATEDRYRNVVVVRRLGSVRLPVEVEISFEDRSVVRERWDGADAWQRYEYVGAQQVRWARVDPNGKLVLDANQLNNSRMRESGTRGIVRFAARWGFWFQNFMLFLTGL